MLRTVLSISGRPGLYKLVSQGKNMVVVESLETGKRIPAYSHEKIIALGDIAVYTSEGEIPLRQVFKSIQRREEGNEVALPKKENSASLLTYFSDILPTFDRDRVYPNDVKKILSWYNTMIKKGMTNFEEPSKEEVQKGEEENGEKSPENPV